MSLCGTTKALTPVRRHFGEQASPLISRKLLNVPPPTTWVPRRSLCSPISAPPMCFRLRFLPASSPTRPAESSSSSCRPPIRFQLLSTPPRDDAVTFGYGALAYPDTDLHRAVCAPSRAHQEPGSTGRPGDSFEETRRYRAAKLRPAGSTLGVRSLYDQFATRVPVF